MKKIPISYQKLNERSIEIHTYHSILSLLHWDQETYMPKGANASRSHQVALLSEHIHELKTCKGYKTDLEKVISLSTGKPKIKGLSKEQLVNIREWRKSFLRDTKIPSSLIKKLSQVTAEASQIWTTAKQENNFKLFAPFLEKIIDLNREKAAIYGFEEHPYDALIESYEPCMSTKKLDRLFSSLKKRLSSLLKKIENAKTIDPKFLHKKVDDATQKAIGEDLLNILPMEKSFSRLDLSSHPFSTAMHPQDSRITTRILPNAFISNIFSILHEVGHSLYEMGLPSAFFGSPMCESVSLSVHESQSRFWETIIGRNLPFWRYFYPKLKKRMPKLLKNIPLKTFYKTINCVKPSLIRVEADEVTYCQHIILRYEIEKELIDGKLQVADLPEAWNAKMKELLNITVTEDRVGCLQDIHWSLGDFGYFPTYALGNLLAAQLFTSFKKKHPDYEERISSGEFLFIRNWLKENIHKWGKMYNLEQLSKKVTGKAFSDHSYCSYLSDKYKKIYQF